MQSYFATSNLACHLPNKRAAVMPFFPKTLQKEVPHE